MTAPSGWHIQQIMAIAHAALARMEADGTLDTDEAALMEALRQEVPAVDDVLVRLLRAAEGAATNQAAVEARERDLAARADRYMRQDQEYRAAAFAILDALGVRKWKSAEFSVSVTAGRQRAVITDETALPDAYVRVTRCPDKAALREALMQGEVIPGAELTNGMPTLSVRTK